MFKKFEERESREKRKTGNRKEGSGRGEWRALSRVLIMPKKTLMSPNYISDLMVGLWIAQESRSMRIVF
jgi:hypothetical protein